MIGDIVTVTVDRPLGSYHPKYKYMYYPINYGYIEGTIAPDGEEQDAYILGVAHPVERFTGKIIAIVHRYDDVEEKWVVCPEDVSFTKEEIIELIRFQEQYYQSEIIMWIPICASDNYIIEYPMRYNEMYSKYVFNHYLIFILYFSRRENYEF